MRSPRLTASREGLAPFVDRPQSLQNMASLQGYVDRASLYSLPSRLRLTPPPLRRPCPSHPPGRPFDRRKSSRASPDVKLAHLGLRLCPLCSPHSWPATQGVMAGFDQKSNVVLSDSKERVYSMEDGVEEIPLGLYLVKGDQMCVPIFSPAALALLTVSHEASS